MMHRVVLQLQGDALSDAMIRMKTNFLHGRKAKRMALGIMGRLMERWKSIEVLRVVQAWRGSAGQAVALASLAADANHTLTAQLAEAKQNGAIGMLGLIVRKMANAGLARVVMNWKKSRSCDILEQKIDSGGVAFLQDAKLKEEQRQRAEEAQVRAERMAQAREKQKRDGGLRLMRRIRVRMDKDLRVHLVMSMISKFREWKQDEWEKGRGLRVMCGVVMQLRGDTRLGAVRVLKANFYADYAAWKSSAALREAEELRKKVKSLQQDVKKADSASQQRVQEVVTASQQKIQVLEGMVQQLEKQLQDATATLAVQPGSERETLLTSQLSESSAKLLALDEQLATAATSLTASQDRMLQQMQAMEEAATLLLPVLPPLHFLT